MTDPNTPASEMVEKQRQFLWDLLDAIDTASDIFKDDYEGLAKRVYWLQQQRFEISDSDGHTVTFKDIEPPAMLAAARGEAND